MSKEQFGGYVLEHKDKDVDLCSWYYNFYLKSSNKRLCHAGDSQLFCITQIYQLVNNPKEIINYGQLPRWLAVVYLVSVGFSTTFSGFRSLCTIRLLWRYPSAPAVSFRMDSTSVSGRPQQLSALLRHRRRSPWNHRTVQPDT